MKGVTVRCFCTGVPHLSAISWASLGSGEPEEGVSSLFTQCPALFSNSKPSLSKNSLSQTQRSIHRPAHPQVTAELRRRKRDNTNWRLLEQARSQPANHRHSCIQKSRPSSTGGLDDRVAHSSHSLLDNLVPVKCGRIPNLNPKTYKLTARTLWFHVLGCGLAPYLRTLASCELSKSAFVYALFQPASGHSLKSHFQRLKQYLPCVDHQETTSVESRKQPAAGSLCYDFCLFFNFHDSRSRPGATKFA
ncbi:hypothetical protein CRENBAI_008417 [Crenichthys baileyi]|uniref:Uncharacterized protein n=1 Tax=Crenichthys baileyi TaxID=28760 RepID=A0AAV9RML8_9TELE